MIELNECNEPKKYEAKKEYVNSCKECRYCRDDYLFDDRYFKCKFIEEPSKDVEQMYRDCPVNHEIMITEEKQLVFEVHNNPGEEFDISTGEVKVYEDKGYYYISKVTSIDCEIDGGNCECNYIVCATLDYNNFEEKYYAKSMIEKICNDLNDMNGFQNVKHYYPW